MAKQAAVLSAQTFRFFRDLGRNNRTEWMQKNRERYQAELVQPLRAMLAALTPSVLKLDSGFDVGGRTGVNFSRINRDIRFAKDKTPYRTQMYVAFPPRGGKSRKSGELYVGLNPESVTAGFRIYFDTKTKAPALANRAAKLPAWSVEQKRRLGRKYESYWYSTEKGQWTKNEGWPGKPEEWNKLKAWVVRRKMKPAAALRPGFRRDVDKVFKELFPLYRFMSLDGAR